MTVAENLFNNLLVFSIIGSIILIFYLRVKKQTLGELIQELRDIGIENE